MIRIVQYVQVEVASNTELSPGHWLLDLAVPKPLPDIRAGQFVTLRCEATGKHSLMRPFSILDYDLQASTISIYYKHLGRLSRRLSEARPGTVLDCLYPLGQGFPWQQDWPRVALVGGGVGIAPLLLCARLLESISPSISVTGFFGGNTKADLVPALLERYAFTMHLATMDGSSGFHGTVVDLYRQRVDSFNVLYACGPNLMMAELQKHLTADIPAFASLEEYMACGVGACLGCVAPIRENDNIVYRTVCKEGPVFDLRKVVFAT